LVGWIDLTKGEFAVVQRAVVNGAKPDDGEGLGIIVVGSLGSAFAANYARLAMEPP
jgi:hypothetical protein